MSKRLEDLTVFLTYSEANPTLTAPDLKAQWERGREMFKTLPHSTNLKKVQDLSELVNEREDLFI